MKSSLNYWKHFLLFPISELVVATPKVKKPPNKTSNRNLTVNQGDSKKRFDARNHYDNAVSSSTQRNFIFKKTEISWRADYTEEEKDGLEPLTDFDDKMTAFSFNQACCYQATILLVTTAFLLSASHAIH